MNRNVGRPRYSRDEVGIGQAHENAWRSSGRFQAGTESSHGSVRHELSEVGEQLHDERGML